MTAGHLSTRSGRRTCRVQTSTTLGVIELANRPLNFVGNLGNPRSYPFPVLYETASSAYVTRIISGDPGLEEAYVSAAQRLVLRGASALIGTCGFAVLYQQAVAAAVDVPVLLSPLSLLPLALSTTSPKSQVLVLTYTGQQLGARFLQAAGVDATSPRIKLRGIEGTSSWRALADPVPCIDPMQLRVDVLAAMQSGLIESERVGAILLECSAFCPLRDGIREAARVPVFDFMLCAELIMAAAANHPPQSAVTPFVAHPDWRDGPDPFRIER